MGETTKNKGFVVNENGDVRNRRCPKCGRCLFSEGEYCEYCGTKINGGKGHAVVWVCVAVVVVAAIVLGFLILQNGDDGDGNFDKDRVINLINTFNDAYAANDFSILSSLYSDSVTRYHNAYNLSNAEVVEHYRNYDSRFGVYAKHISVRWESLQIDRVSDFELSVVFVEDYCIDRVDNSKYSIFVLEEHLILDKDYKIKSIYDVQLSRKRKNTSYTTNQSQNALSKSNLEKTPTITSQSGTVKVVQSTSTIKEGNTEFNRSINYGTGYRKLVRPISTSVNEEGQVCVEVHVMPDGTVSEAQVINSSKQKTTISNRQIQQQCVQVAKQAKYDLGKEELRIIVFR